jgi:plastocyanin domain-containing protein
MKTTIFSIIVAVALIGLAFLLSGNKNGTDAANINNVNIVDGKQIVEITAKYGYQPRKSLARAGLPTIIRFKTDGAFDCSSSVRIPSLGISRVLPQTGATDIDIGSPTAPVLRGTCAMGMYSFEIDFQD